MQYDLEERCLKFAKRTAGYVNNLPKNQVNQINGHQLIRSSGSTGANYIEANECLGKKDFGMRVKISRKEAKESEYWLRLTEPREAQTKEQDDLIQESIELRKIFGSIVEKTKF